MEFPGPVAGSRDDCSIHHYNGADRRLVTPCGKARLLQCGVHETAGIHRSKPSYSCAVKLIDGAAENKADTMTGYERPPRGGKNRGDSPRRSAQASGGKRGEREGDAPGAGSLDGENRIAKVLARLGVASRRDAEEMVREGRVSVNGKRLDTPAVTVSYSDKIEVDGKPVAGLERTRLWLYHKPAGLVTTNKDPEGRPTVFDNLPPDLPRVMSIGRLDINTEGLLLLTNDGGLARTLELPQTGWLRRYRVRAYGEIDQAKLDTLQDGIAVDGVLYGAIEATLDRTQGHNSWMTIGLREGKNREIKNVLGALGLDVNRLIRISFGPFQLGDIPEGEAVEIKSRTLREQLGDRLAEESGANFDAPVIDRKARPEADEEKPARRSRTFGEEGGRDWVSAGDPRERARAKLDTKPRTPPRRRGAANVWMAPGARPEGAEKKPKRPRPAGDGGAFAERPQRDPAARKPRPASGERPARSGRDDRRSDRPGGGRPDKPFNRDGARRPDRQGEGGRAEGRSFDKPRGKPFGKPASGADRPRSDKPRSDRPRSDKTWSDKPRSDKPRGDRPQFEKPRRDGARRDGQSADASGAERKSYGKPRGKPFGKPEGRPGGRPDGNKPRGNFGGKPDGKPGGRPGGKPGGRPGGGRPRSGGGAGSSGGPKGRGGADRRR